MTEQLYTLVQHSGYSVGGNPQFLRAVELQSVHNQETFNLIQRVGGYIYDNYKEASDAEYSTNYPSEVYGFLVPNVAGGFSEATCEGKKIYTPGSAK